VQGLVGGRRIEVIERVDVQVVLSFGVWLGVRGLWWVEVLFGWEQRRNHHCRCLLRRR
jgi:hypothetical protein